MATISKVEKNVQSKDIPKKKNTGNVTGQKECKRIKDLLNFVEIDLVEKDEATRLALLAGIAGESIFFLGPPGTAKSMVSRRLRYAFRGDNSNDLRYFEYLMNQFSTPDEVYGPVSLKALEDNRYERITEGYLPSADIAFLDEIWKAGPAIQNTLLTIINEKKFHNGNKVIKVPLKVLVSASNELPAENQGLEALWDRFLVRVIVSPVKDEDKFMSLICGGDISTELDVPENIKKIQISLTDIKDWSKKAESINVPDFVKNVITSIRKEMTLRNGEEDRNEKEKYYVSDRRWKKIVKLLKISAFLNNRNAVDLMDCQLITYCIWNTENQIEEAKEIVSTCIEQNGITVKTSLFDIKEEIKEFDDYVNKMFYTHGPKKEKMRDGMMAYVLSKEKRINEYSSNPKIKYISKSKYYDSNRNDIKINGEPVEINVIKNGDYFELNWKHKRYGGMVVGTSYEKMDEILEISDTSYERDSYLYDRKDLLKTRQDNADLKYNTILKIIKKESNNVDGIIKKRMKSIKSNIFADQRMSEFILSSLEKTKLQLKETEKELNEIRSKYQ